MTALVGRDILKTRSLKTEYGESIKAFAGKAENVQTAKNQDQWNRAMDQL